MSMILWGGLTILLGSAALGFYIYQSRTLNKCNECLNACLTVDSLTQLPNGQSLACDFKEGEFLNTQQGIVLLNIDNFKIVNGLMDKQDGDNLMREIATRINVCLSEDAGLYHLGGDLFAIYIKQVDSSWQVEQLVQLLFEYLERPIILEKTQLFLNFSAGIALSPTDGKDLVQLIKSAEMSMYMAKKKGQNHYEFFAPQVALALEKESLFERELRHAIDNQAFTLVYQPKVALGTYHIIGYEALIRWHNTLLGNVSPELFICRAEETKLIIPIGRWVLYESCMMIKRINAQALIPKTIAINVSVVEVLQEDFVPQLLSILKGLQISPSWIQLELTESLFFDYQDIVIEKLITLKEAGLSLAIDDFGKEYSALSYLIKLPIDHVKIDKAFIDTIGTKDEWIVSTLVDICHKMKCHVTAEGVELQSQLEFLRQIGCDQVQGYVFSKPVKEEELLGLHFEL